MVYNIKYSSGAPLVSIPDSTQDTTTTSLTLVGRNSVSFGIAINQNFVDLLQNFAASSPPRSPLQGQFWFDNVSQSLKLYDGAKWITVNQAFDGSSGVLSTKVGSKNTDVSCTISQYQIITVVSADRIPRSECPSSVVINDVSYSFAARFPNGIYPGINLATDPTNAVSYVMNGTASYANVLANSRTINFTGDIVGSFKFDGSSNVNVNVSSGNIFVNNTNVTVAGTYTKVRVNSGGRVIAGNNLVASDIVSALGYTPYDGSNVTVNSVGNTIVGRDINGNFASNVVVVNDVITSNVIASNYVSAVEFIGTVSNARVLTTPRVIYVNGDVYGNAEFDGSTDIVIQSNLVTSGVTAGTYNLVNVDSKGRVTNGTFFTPLPLDSIVLYPGTITPAGWVVCDGSIVTDPVTGVRHTTPNLVLASSSISTGSGVTLRYIMQYTSAIPELTANQPGSGPVVIIGGEVFSNPAVPAVSSALSGGPSTLNIPGGFSGIDIGTAGEAALNPAVTFSNTGFMDTAYFDALALVFSIGDTNAVMFEQTAIWKNIGSLTVQQVIDNLNLRSNSNLAAAIGKYMIPIQILKTQIAALDVPSNFVFSPQLQDQLISSITSMYAHQLSVANLPANENNLLGCHYLGSASAWIKILKSEKGSLVSDTLLNSGYYIPVSSQLGNYTRDELLDLMARIMQIASSEIAYRKQTGNKVISSGVYPPSTGNVASASSANGFWIGNANFTEMNGGYFADYYNGTIPGTVTGTVGPSSEFGSAGVISVSLSDAGAAALAAILQTANSNDQAGLSQLIVNRTGATIIANDNFGGKSLFESATFPDAFSAISAALYGPNDNQSASDLYGNLAINRDYLRDALDLEDTSEMQTAVAQLFQGTLTSAQLFRLGVLRQQIFNNGPEMSQARAAIGKSVNYVAPGTSVPNVIFPFGNDANGYITISSLAGFYIPNTSDVAITVSAPSPDALLNRLMNNLTSTSGNIINENVNRFTVPGTYTFIVEAYSGVISIELAGGGGGGGGWDKPYGGFNGYGGHLLSGIVTDLLPGDTITVYVGGGGKAGAPGTNIPGGIGGLSTGGFSGGQGGRPSTQKGWSGSGAGGGAATAIYIKGNLFAVAAGGGGGGGGGLYSPGQPQAIYSANGINNAGGAGKNDGDDGGGGGGGGGGYPGGLGGDVGIGDTGAKSGCDGADLVPPRFTKSVVNNGGAAAYLKSTDGGDGYVIISYTKQ